jgi:diguanylate cyclase (GGDEF)-like protein
MATRKRRQSDTARRLVLRSPLGWSFAAVVLVLGAGVLGAGAGVVGAAAGAFGAIPVVAVGALAVVLALSLGQGRAALAAVWLFGTSATVPLLDTAAAGLLDVVVPFGVALCALGSDRAPFGRRNQRRFLLLVLAGLLVWGCGKFAPEQVLAWLAWPPGLASAGVGTVGDRPLVHLALALVGLALLLRAIFGGDEATRAGWVSLLALASVDFGVATGTATAAALAAWAVAAVEGASVLAWRDALTRLPGRRAFDRTLAELPPGAVVAMVDIDHFKALNDRYGHDVGDEVLAMVAAQLASGRGRAFRWGGEEFVVVLRGRHAGEAFEHLEALRAGIAGRRFVVRGAARGLSVTVSIGFAARRRGEGAAATLAGADRALYRAKEGGRNRVVGPNRPARDPARSTGRTRRE